MTRTVIDSWVLVPADPLPEMLAAFWRQKNRGTQDPESPPVPDETYDYAAYRAMLEAVPRPADVDERTWQALRQRIWDLLRDDETDRDGVLSIPFRDLLDLISWSDHWFRSARPDEATRRGRELIDDFARRLKAHSPGDPVWYVNDDEEPHLRLAAEILEYREGWWNIGLSDGSSANVPPSRLSPRDPTKCPSCQEAGVNDRQATRPTHCRWCGYNHETGEVSSLAPASFPSADWP